MDMIFLTCRLQEKFFYLRVALYQDFVDLTKTSDSINRDALLNILGKIEFPPEFIRMFKQLYMEMKGQFNINGSVGTHTLR